MAARNPTALITPQTAEVSAKARHIVPEDEKRTFAAGGAADADVLGSGETVDVFYTINDGDSWHTLYDREGVAVQLTDTLGPITICGPITLGFTKTATAQSVGVYVYPRRF